MCVPVDGSIEDPEGRVVRIRDDDVVRCGQYLRGHYSTMSCRMLISLIVG